MSNAQQIFVLYAVAALTAGFVLGGVDGVQRMKNPAARKLASAHVEVLMQANMHFGLAFALGITGFGSSWAPIGAGLLVVGSIMQALGATMNAVGGTKDQFADQTRGLSLNSASSLFMFPGLAITIIGIVANA